MISRQLNSLYYKYEIVVKLMITLVVLAFLLYSINGKLYQLREIDFSGMSYLQLLIVILLMPLNWGMEAFKWRFLMKKEGKLSFLEAYTIILQGLALGFFTPGRAGDAIFRVSSGYGKSSSKAYAVFLNGASQFTTTLIFGFFAVIGLHRYYQFSQTWLYVVLAIGGVGIALYLLMPFLTKVLYNRWTSKVRLILGYYGVSDYYKALLISFLRYMVFVIQFYLVARMLEFPLSSFHIFTAIALVFLLKSLVPFFNLFGELGLREAVTVLVFSRMLLVNEMLALTGSILLWVINMAIPVLIGLVFYSFSHSKKTEN